MKIKPRFGLFVISFFLILFLSTITLSVHISYPEDRSILEEDDFPLEVPDVFEITENENDFMLVEFNVTYIYSNGDEYSEIIEEGEINFDDDLEFLEVIAIYNNEGSLFNPSEKNTYYVEPEEPHFDFIYPNDFDVLFDDEVNLNMNFSEDVTVNVSVNDDKQILTKNYSDNLNEPLSLDENQENEILIIIENEEGITNEKLIHVYHLDEKIELDTDQDYYSMNDSLSGTLKLPIEGDFTLKVEHNNDTLWQTDIDSSEEYSFSYGFDGKHGEFNFIVDFHFNDGNDYEILFNKTFNVLEDSFTCDIDSSSIFGLDERGYFDAKSNVDDCRYSWDVNGTTYVGESIDFSFSEIGDKRLELTCECYNFNKTSVKNIEIVEDYMLEINVYDDEENDLNNVIVNVNNRDFFLRDNPLEVSFPEGIYDINVKKETFLDSSKTVNLSERKKQVDFYLEKPSRLQEEFEITDFNYSIKEDETYDFITFNYNFSNEDIFENCILFELKGEGVGKPLSSSESLSLTHATFLNTNKKYQINCYNTLGGFDKREVILNISDGNLSSFSKEDYELSNISLEDEHEKIMELLGYDLDDIDLDEDEGLDLILDYYEDINDFSLVEKLYRSEIEESFVEDSVILFDELDFSLFYGEFYSNFIEKNIFKNSLIDNSQSFTYTVYEFNSTSGQSLNNIKSAIQIESSNGVIFSKPDQFDFQDGSEVYSVENIYYTQEEVLTLTSKESVDIENLSLVGFSVSNVNQLNSSIPLIYYFIFFLGILTIIFLFITVDFSDLFKTDKDLKRRNELNNQLNDSLNQNHLKEDEKETNENSKSFIKNIKLKINNIQIKTLFSFENILLSFVKSINYFRRIFIKRKKKNSSEKDYDNIEKINNKNNPFDDLSKEFKPKSINKDYNSYKDYLNADTDLNENSIKDEIITNNFMVNNNNNNNDLSPGTDNNYNQNPNNFNNNYNDYKEVQEDNNSSSQENILNLAKKAENLINSDSEKAYEKYIELKSQTNGIDMSSKSKINEIMFDLEMYFSNYFIYNNKLNNNEKS